MRLAIALISIAVLSALPVLADLSASTSGYLKEIGLDPQSAEIASVEREAVPLRNGGTASLDELARQKKSKQEILRFVSTRRFVKAYRENPNTRLPATDDYDADYLTDEEKALVQPAFRKAGDELYLRSLQQEKKKK
jgi:hypothetical protein